MRFRRWYWIRWFSVLDIEALVQAIDGSWIHFTRPSQVVQTADASRVAYTIRAVEEATRTREEWAVGFLTYEAGGAFGLRVRPSSSGLPLVWFAIFRAPTTRFERLSQWCSGSRRSVGTTVGTITATLTAEESRRCSIASRRILPMARRIYG